MLERLGVDERSDRGDDGGVACPLHAIGGLARLVLEVPVDDGNLLPVGPPAADLVGQTVLAATDEQGDGQDVLGQASEQEQQYGWHSLPDEKADDESQQAANQHDPERDVPAEEVEHPGSDDPPAGPADAVLYFFGWDVTFWVML